MIPNNVDSGLTNILKDENLRNDYLGSRYDRLSKDFEKANKTEERSSKKVRNIASIVVSLMIVWTVIGKFLDFGPNLLNLEIPLLCIYYLLETICNWKKDKDI